ncbi:hypothetical protein GGS20DRAFT_556556 [Poronia punctata]|nr:hypothetical protein GGS20DRAFT_556556 [Poronia punctata]
MAPDSRIIITRHAQAEHNVHLDYSIPDPPLTPLGIKQAASLAPPITGVTTRSRPSRHITTQAYARDDTYTVGWAPAIQRLGGLRNVVCLPEAQESNGYPCDTGSSREALERDPELARFDFARLTPDWTSKRGIWAPIEPALVDRAAWVRRFFLRDRPEKNTYRACGAREFYKSLLCCIFGNISLTPGSLGPTDLIIRDGYQDFEWFSPSN